MGGDSSPGFSPATTLPSSGGSWSGRSQPISPPTAAVADCENCCAIAENRAPWCICCVRRSASARSSASCEGLSTARKISATRLSGSLACSLARCRAASISSSEISVVCAAIRRTSFAQTIDAVSWLTSALRSMARALRNSFSAPAFILFCFSICARALSISLSVAVTPSFLASWSSSFSSIKPRSTCGARRLRVSGVSGMFEESMTMRIRETRSKTEMTSSFTTAAMRISGGPAGGWVDAGGDRITASRLRDCAEWLGLERTATASASAPSQRNIAIETNPAAATDRSNLHLRRCAVAARRRAASQRAPRNRRDGAANFPQVLENHAEHHRYAGRHVAGADPRLGDRADKRHALVLIHRRQICIKAAAVRLRHRNAVDEVARIRQVYRLAANERPIARQLAGDADRELLALAEQHGLTGHRVGDDVALLLRRLQQIIDADPQVRWPGGEPDLLRPVA